MSTRTSIIAAVTTVLCTGVAAGAKVWHPRDRVARQVASLCLQRKPVVEGGQLARYGS